MTQDMLHVIEWHNGEKHFSPFSDAEMTRRQSEARAWMAANDVDAALFTSYHCINYYSGWLYCAFGRKYGMVLTQDESTTISAGIDGGQAWRRSFGRNVTYTDWRRDNFYRALRQLTAGVQRLAIEFDTVSLDFRRMLDAALPGVEMVDIGAAAMWMRTVKSAEEQALIRKGARIASLAAAGAAALIREGLPEFEVASAATDLMNREIAASFPHVDLMDSWTWFQSGVNTDGAHNPVTNRRVRRGDILSLNCFPMIFGYYTALGRTLFYGHVDDASLGIWEKNVAVQKRGVELVRPGAKCNEIASELNEMYRGWGLLKHRSYGYGHSFGVLSHYYGREAGIELREDVQTELRPGMVISMEPMVMLPQGMAGAGGYREHDILIVTESGAEKITDFPSGPEHNIIRA
ncbi:aminopeptidase P family protein [Paragemmobacter straminiformis]|uniref:M24 family metallopeptidase n=1 Tax=Paragemmobacter straminiformis TaxID=2045119 RepID=A0A842I5J9_9RHOB|nr:aminopeptidase P family protein [Gemmobacter straminiformis]MBC2835100.1 M24 family metallopeptidase [Gemmobacter straminiformis]